MFTSISTALKNAFDAGKRQYVAICVVDADGNRHELHDENIVSNSLSIVSSIASGNSINIGEAIASELSFSIFNDPNSDDYADTAAFNFKGATVKVFCGAVTNSDGSIDKYGFISSESEINSLDLACAFSGKTQYFINVSDADVQFSGTTLYTMNSAQAYKLFRVDSAAVIERSRALIPMGVFTIDEVVMNNDKSIIKIKALDNLIRLDKPFNAASITTVNGTYPFSNIYNTGLGVCGTAFEDNTFYTRIQQLDDVLETLRFYIKTLPDGVTWRNIYQYIAQLCGVCLTANRFGKLRAIPIKTGNGNDPYYLTPSGRKGFKLNSVSPVRAVGVVYKKKTKKTQPATINNSGIIFDLTNNTLLNGLALSGNKDGIAGETWSLLLDGSAAMTFVSPFESQHPSVGYIDVGDKIRLSSDNTVTTLLTNYTWKPNGFALYKTAGKETEQDQSGARSSLSSAQKSDIREQISNETSRKTVFSSNAAPLNSSNASYETSFELSNYSLFIAAVRCTYNGNTYTKNILALRTFTDGSTVSESRIYGTARIVGNAYSVEYSVDLCIAGNDRTITYNSSARIDMNAGSLVNSTPCDVIAVYALI